MCKLCSLSQNLDDDARALEGTDAPVSSSEFLDTIKESSRPPPVSPSGERELSVIDRTADSPTLEGEPSHVVRAVTDNLVRVIMVPPDRNPSRGFWSGDQNHW